MNQGEFAISGRDMRDGVVLNLQAKGDNDQECQRGSALGTFSGGRSNLPL